MNEEKPLPNEEIRQLMSEQFDDYVEETALKVASEFWPELDSSFVVEKIMPKLRKAVFDAMPAETRCP